MTTATNEQAYIACDYLSGGDQYDERAIQEVLIGPVGQNILVLGAAWRHETWLNSNLDARGRPRKRTRLVEDKSMPFVRWLKETRGFRSIPHEEFFPCPASTVVHET